MRWVGGISSSGGGGGGGSKNSEGFHDGLWRSVLFHCFTSLVSWGSAD
jgi:hypothetical protein